MNDARADSEDRNLQGSADASLPAAALAPDAATRFSLLYPELKRLARARLRREDTFTLLDTTALLHESFMRLARNGQIDSQERPAFFAYAGQVMRSVIVDHARARLAQRRGERPDLVPLDTSVGNRISAPEDQVMKVNEALRVLELAEPRLARIVEMQYFGGFTDQEIAATLGISDRTVRRDWDKARLLLQVALR
jgi:RNA polymerase sigma factor (TIGR02999 family)